MLLIAFNALLTAKVPGGIEKPLQSLTSMMLPFVMLFTIEARLVDAVIFTRPKAE